MKRIYWLKISVLFLVFFSCTSEQEIQKKTILVASKQVDCTGVGPQKCMLIKEHATQNWEYFYDTIEGFNYEEGFEYVLNISEKEISPVPADASSIQTILIEIISKTKKDSENLPTICSGNPLEELAWLKLIKEDLEISTSLSKKEIIQYTYKGNTVFLINPCKDCADGLITVYDCNGEKQCEFGGIGGKNTCPDFDMNATSKILLWEN